MNLLDKDLDEAETQQRKAIQQHQDNQIKLKTLQKERIDVLDDEWNTSVAELKLDQISEIEELEKWYKSEFNELCDIFKLLSD